MEKLMQLEDHTASELKPQLKAHFSKCVKTDFSTEWRRCDKIGPQTVE